MRGCTALLLAAALAVAGLAAAAAQAPGAGLLPVRIHERIATFRGDGDTVIARSDGGEYLLYSAHKEGGRPWADAIFVRRDRDGVTYLSRAYDCAAGTWRWMGEHDDITRISRSVGSIADIRPRPVEPGTVEHALARHVCAL